MNREAERWMRLERLLRDRARQPGGRHITDEDLAYLCGVIETTPELNERHADSVLIGVGARRAATLREMYANRFGDPRPEEGGEYATEGLLDLAHECQMIAAGEDAGPTQVIAISD